MKIKVLTEDELQGQMYNAPKHTRALLIFLVLIIFGSGIFAYIINMPNHGQITTTSTTKASATDVAPKTLISPYYTVEYPGDFETKTNIPKGADQLDLHVIQKPSLRNNAGSTRISYGVEPLPSTGVTSMSPYILASAYPASFTIITTPCGDDICTILDKYDDNSTKIILWPHNNDVLIAALSAQTAGSPAEYDVLAKQIISTLKWK